MVEAGCRDELRVAWVGDRRAGVDLLHPAAQVAGAELLGARLCDRADSPASEHRVDPVGCVAGHGEDHVATADALLAERPGQPGGPVGDLAEGDLAPVAVPGNRDQRWPCRVGSVDDVADEVHSRNQCSPWPTRSRPSHANSMAVSSTRSRRTSLWSSHQFATDWIAPTSICARSWMPRSASGWASSRGLARGSCAIKAATSAVIWAVTRSSAAADSGSTVSRNSTCHASRRSSTNSRYASRPVFSRMSPESAMTGATASAMRRYSSLAWVSSRLAWSSCFEAKCS